MGLESIEITSKNVSTFRMLDKAIDSIIVSDEIDSRFDELAFINELKKIQWLKKIKRLTISHNSTLRNLNILECFPALRKLSVYSYSIENFDGIQYFINGEYIEIDTGKNKKRNITALKYVKIKKINLRYANANDILVIGDMITLKDIMIINAEKINIGTWGRLDLDSLQLINGSFEKIQGKNVLKKIKALTISKNKYFTEFKELGGYVKLLIIQYCPNMIIESLDTFKGIENLIIIDNEGEIFYNSIMKLEKINNIKILGKRLKILDPILIDKDKNIPQISINTMTKADIAKIEKNHPEIKNIIAC